MINKTYDYYLKKGIKKGQKQERERILKIINEFDIVNWKLCPLRKLRNCEVVMNIFYKIQKLKEKIEKE